MNAPFFCMKYYIYQLKQFLLPIAFFIVVVCVALFSQQNREWFLPILFLLLPLADRRWLMPAILFRLKSLISWAVLVFAMTALLLHRPDILDLFTVMVLVAALPEEWFFRAYLQKRLGNSVVAVLFVSLIFSFMHSFSRGPMLAALVFIPSVFFGWVYKKTDDLVVVVMLHALSNLVYYIYLESYILENVVG